MAESSAKGPSWWRRKRRHPLVSLYPGSVLRVRTGGITNEDTLQVVSVSTGWTEGRKVYSVDFVAAQKGS